MFALSVNVRCRFFLKQFTFDLHTSSRTTTKSTRPGHAARVLLLLLLLRAATRTASSSVSA